MAKSFNELFGPGLSREEALRLLNMMHGPAYEQGDALQELIQAGRESDAADILSEGLPPPRNASASPQLQRDGLPREPPRGRADIPPGRALARSTRKAASSAAGKFSFGTLARGAVRQLPWVLAAMEGVRLFSSMQKSNQARFVEGLQRREEGVARGDEYLAIDRLRDEAGSLSNMVQRGEQRAAGRGAAQDAFGDHIERQSILETIAAGREASLAAVAQESRPSVAEIYARHGLL